MGITDKKRGLRRGDEKGSIYSLEFLFSFMMAVVIVYIILSYLFSGLNEITLNEKDFELKRKAVTISEAIVKQNNPENPLLGSAYFNTSKRRVESNKIDLALFTEIDDKSLPKEFAELSELKIIFLDGKEISAAKPEKKSKNCVAIERMIITSEIIPRKGKLLARLCDE